MSDGVASLGVTAVRWCAWLLVVSGPVLGAVALLSSPEPQPSAPQRAGGGRSGGDASGPAGFATLYVETYLGASPAGRDGQEQLTPFFPDVRDAGPPAQEDVEPVEVESAAAVRVERVAARYWSVTVAARTDSGVRYFQVPVRGGTQGALRAAALPGEVAAPAGGGGPELGYGSAREAVGSAPLVQTLDAVFGAYLAGGGGLDRYVAPGVSLSPVSPAPYQEVRVRRLAEVGESDPLATAQESPRDGQRRELLVQVEATDSSDAVWPLSYALELAARDGRWEVADLQAAPVLDSSEASSTSSSGKGGRS